MRNIVVHPVVRGVRSGAGLESVHVEGHAFGLERVEVRLSADDATCKTVVSVGPTSHWTAHFSRARDGVLVTWSEKAELKVVAADPDDPSGCYASLEARVQLG
jgi:hypothetical protein